MNYTIIKEPHKSEYGREQEPLKTLTIIIKSLLNVHTQKIEKFIVRFAFRLEATSRNRQYTRRIQVCM